MQEVWGEKRSRFKKIVIDNKVDFLMIQETKKDVSTENFVQSLWGSRKFEFTEVDAAGMSGGLMCIWNPEVFAVEGICSGRNFIIISGFILNSFPCVFANVYGPCQCSERLKVWESLINRRFSFPNPWCVGGDFNEIRNLGERQGSSIRDRGMYDFNSFIDSLELIDLPLLGRKFTWENSVNATKWSRLDRFLIHSEWLSRFNWKQWGLGRVLSDHCPIILKVDSRDWGPKPFRFLNAWTLHPKFKMVVKEFWESSDIQGWAGFRVARKLKGLKGC